ncbi:MAG TPA: hypothetical protein PKV71_19425 [Calditrichia bacterium]|nr:hypothetical protein [Calditrichota bacterium]HQU71917.1 hypothetical protein [Calditrichia bacterium]HQV34069.1 hypothetical protein [Calditrichia bacterium]
MYGSVIGYNANQGLVLAETDTGYYVIFEVAENFPVAAGDLLQGNMETRGWQMLFNKTRCRDLNVMVRTIFNSYRDACAALDSP